MRNRFLIFAILKTDYACYALRFFGLFKFRNEKEYDLRLAILAVNVKNVPRMELNVRQDRGLHNS